MWPVQKEDESVDAALVAQLDNQVSECIDRADPMDGMDSSEDDLAREQAAESMIEHDDKMSDEAGIVVRLEQMEIIVQESQPELFEN